MFFLLYTHTDDGVVDYFPKISDQIPKISQNSSEGQTNVPEHMPMTLEEDPKMFRSYTNEFKYNLRDKLDISEVIDIFTYEDMEDTPLGSRM